MFTGIIEELGKIRSISSSKIEIVCKTVLEGTKIGDSISVNGVCLTVTEVFAGGFAADISHETLKVTNFNNLKAGNYVNLERAIKADGRFGGHIVSGHIDCIGKFKSIAKIGEFYNLEVEIAKEYSQYIIKKGSIGVNGISLTIVEIKGTDIGIAVIPHTFENTNLKYLEPGDFVNIEVDMSAKYIEKFLSTSDNKSRIDYNFLEKCGFN